MTLILTYVVGWFFAFGYSRSVHIATNARAARSWQSRTISAVMATAWPAYLPYRLGADIGDLLWANGRPK